MNGLGWFLAAPLLVATAVPAEARRVAVAGEPGLVLDQRTGRTELHLSGVAVPLGAYGTCDTCVLREARLLGRRPGAALILLVTYDSRPGTPGGMCGAGEEVVMVVVRLRPRPEPAAGLLLSSCWHDVEASGDPTWDTGRGLLTAARWTRTSGAVPERWSWRIDRDGRVTPVAS